MGWDRRDPGKAVMSPVRRVALVGAKGFLGLAIREALSVANHLVSPFDLDRPLIIAGRLAEEAQGAEVFVWAASSVNPALALEHPDWVAADKAFFSDALTTIGRVNPQARIVLLSSGGTVYGPPSEPPYTESDPVHPVNSYGKSKVDLERMLRKSGLEGISLRIANAYGPGQRPAPGQGVIAHWLLAAKEGCPFHVFGDLETSRDYIFIDDVASSVVAVTEADALPPVLNVGSGRPAALSEILRITLEVTGRTDGDVVYQPARSIDISRTWLSIEAAQSQLDWQPKTALAEGIRASWEATRGG